MHPVNHPGLNLTIPFRSSFESNFHGDLLVTRESFLERRTNYINVALVQQLRVDLGIGPINNRKVVRVEIDSDGLPLVARSGGKRYLQRVWAEHFPVDVGALHEAP